MPSVATNRPVTVEEEEYLDLLQDGVRIGDDDEEERRRLIQQLRTAPGGNERLELATRLVKRYPGNQLVEFTVEEVLGSESDPSIRSALKALIA